MKNGVTSEMVKVSIFEKGYFWIIVAIGGLPLALIVPHDITLHGKQINKREARDELIKQITPAEAMAEYQKLATETSKEHLKQILSGNKSIYDEALSDRIEREFKDIKFTQIGSAKLFLLINPKVDINTKNEAKRIITDIRMRRVVSALLKNFEISLEDVVTNEAKFSLFKKTEENERAIIEKLREWLKRNPDAFSINID